MDGRLQVNNQQQVFTLTDVFRSRRREPGPVLLLDLRSINAPGRELFLEQRTGTDLPYLTYTVVFVIIIIIIIIIFKFTLLSFKIE